VNTCKKNKNHWKDDLNSILINILETYSNAPQEYVVQLFNSLRNTNVIRSQVHNNIEYMYEEKENCVGFANSVINNIPILGKLPIVENILIIENVPINK
jgi:hypothetical protein